MKSRCDSCGVPIRPGGRHDCTPTPAEEVPEPDVALIRIRNRSVMLLIAGGMLFALGWIMGPVLLLAARSIRRQAAGRAPYLEESRKLTIAGGILTAAGLLLIPSLVDLLTGRGSAGLQVYVDSSLSQSVRMQVDGKPVGQVHPNLLKGLTLDRGRRKIALRDAQGNLVEEIDVTLSSGLYIYNPGAARRYELKTISYSKYGLGGENWTRAFGPGRWHEVRDRVDYEFTRPPDSISGYGGEKKTWLTRVD
jgi:hypothetical protein